MYDLAPDYLALTWQAVERGELLVGDALAEPEQHAMPQRIAIGDVFPAAVQRIDALCKQDMDRVRDAGGAAGIGKCPDHGTRQSDTTS